MRKSQQKRKKKKRKKKKERNLDSERLVNINTIKGEVRMPEEVFVDTRDSR